MSDASMNAERFDTLFSTVRRAAPEKVWGAPAIAKMLGVGIDKVYALALHPAAPIYRPEGSGSYFAFRHELEAWLRTKPTPAAS